MLKQHRARHIPVGPIVGGMGGAAQEVAVSAVAAFDGSKITLTWSSPSYAYAAGAYFQVYKADRFLTTVPASIHTYVDTHVSSGTTYTYRVTFLS